MNSSRILAAGVLGAAALIPLALSASPVPTLTSFQAGQPVRAAEFNANFSALKDAVDDNDTRIGDLSNLQTSAKGDLVAAINEARSSGGAQGPQGPTGPQGPAGTQKIVFGGFSTSGAPGGGTNTLTGGSTLVRIRSVNPIAAFVSGRPYSITVQLQTVDPTAGGDNPGAPATPGNLSLDLVFNWSTGGDSGSALSPTITNVATIVLDAGVNNDKSVTFTGTVPAAPSTTGGLKGMALSFIEVRVNSGAAVNGQYVCAGTGFVTLP